MQINLKLSLTHHKALNQDGATALRSLPLIQGEVYRINLQFLEDTVAFTPALTNFAFSLRGSTGENLLTVNTATAVSGDYPYYFSLPLSSPVLSAALAGQESIELKGILSYEADGALEVIEPFIVRLFATGGEVSAYVHSLNGLEGEVGITGKGLSVSTSGNTLVIDVAAPYQTYATPAQEETKTLTATSPLLWLVDASLSDGCLMLPDANLVDGREYRVRKVDGSAHLVGVFGPVGQTMKNVLPGTEGVAMSFEGQGVSFLAAGGVWFYTGEPLLSLP